MINAAGSVSTRASSSAPAPGSASSDGPSETTMILVYVLIAIIVLLAIYIVGLGYTMAQKKKQKRLERERKEKEKELRRLQKRNARLQDRVDTGIVPSGTGDSSTNLLARAKTISSVNTEGKIHRVDTRGSELLELAQQGLLNVPTESLRDKTEPLDTPGSTKKSQDKQDKLPYSTLGDRKTKEIIHEPDLPNGIVRPVLIDGGGFQQQYPTQIQTAELFMTKLQETRLPMGNNNTTFNQEVTLDVGEGIAVPAFLNRILALDFKIDKVLAEGGASVVYLGTALHPELAGRAGEPTIVIKQLKVSTDEKFLVAFQQELSVMWFLRSNINIAKMIGFSFQPPMILLKYYSIGPLSSYIRQHRSKNNNQRKYRKRQCVQFALDTARGLLHMHMHQIVHLDMKTGNILLDRVNDNAEELYAVITDFGLAQILNPQKIVVSGFKVSKLKGLSLAYAAPEIVAKNILGQLDVTSVTMNSQEYNQREYTGADIYSFGMILFEMIHRKTPWKQK